tara:strand:- start:1034 stop:1162 length:129 start_codon:yes stop_codon:yes gene_type:complete
MSGANMIDYVALPYARCTLKYMIYFNFSFDRGYSVAIEPIQL